MRKERMIVNREWDDKQVDYFALLVKYIWLTHFLQLKKTTRGGNCVLL